MSDENCCGACGYPIHATKDKACDWCRQSADRIDALTEQLEAARADAEEAEAYAEELARDLVKADNDINDRDAKLAKAVELLKEARQDLEEYVTHEWPKDEHPVYGRKWERDMELCRRIDATLAEIEGEKT
jgi:septal ring factor EnvC (AmiA/AmiB activator)